MALNVKKTNLICFNPTTTKQAVPFISLKDGSPLLCQSTMRLLGVIFDQELTWWPLVEDLVSRANSRVWTLVKLREFGAKREQLVENYVLKIRSVLEYAAPVVSCILNAAQSAKIESVQIRCCQIIMGASSKSYRSNLWSLSSPSGTSSRS